MTKPEYFQFAEQFFGKCLEISKAKNADYTGGAADPFANFKAVEILGITTEQGFLTRMMDKMKRIASFAEKGELQVKDESVTDTLRDLANYACLLAGYIESKKPAFTHSVQVHEGALMQFMEGSPDFQLKEKPVPEVRVGQPCANTSCAWQVSGRCSSSSMMYSVCKDHK